MCKFAFTIVTNAPEKIFTKKALQDARFCNFLTLKRSLAEICSSKN